MKGLAAFGLAMVMTLGLSATALAATEDEAQPTATQAQEESERPSGRTGSGKSRKSSGRVNVLAVAAEVLGQDKDEVKEAVSDAKVGDLLLAADKLDEFKALYLETAKTKLDEAVAAGSMTQAEADEKYAEYEQKMAEYDGTTHLCGRDSHKKTKDSAEETAQPAV